MSRENVQFVHLISVALEKVLIKRLLDSVTPDALQQIQVAGKDTTLFIIVLYQQQENALSIKF
jgi:hypothetical protein